MSKCEQCIVREFSSLKTLTKDELLKLSYCKTSHSSKKGAVTFEEGENVNGIYCLKDGICIPKSEVMGCFGKNNQFSMNVMKSICGDLKEADDHMVHLAQKTVKGRLAGALLYLHDTFGKNEDNSLKVQL